MIPLPSAVSSGLTWKKLPRNGGYEFQRGNEVLGTLKRPSIWCNRIAETPHGKWMFRRCGFLGTSAEIVEVENRQPIATFKSSWGMQGVLTFADGECFQLACKGVFHPVWSFTDERGETVMSLHSREKSVERAHTHLSEDRVLLLTMFSLDRILQAEEDAASAAVVAVFS